MYRLTEYGADLGPIVRDLGRWAARRMDAPREGDAPTNDSLASALQTGRTAAAVEPFVVQVVAGPAVAWERVLCDGIEVGPGEAPEGVAVDLVLGGPGLRRLMADGDHEAAVGSGLVEFEGEALWLGEFVKAFRTPLDDVSSRESVAG